MNYELTTAWRTIRKEGVCPLLAKLRLYVGQMLAARRFGRTPRPATTDPETIIDFGWTAAGGLIQPGQVRSELVQLARQVDELKPKRILEIGTAGGGTLFVWCALADPSATIVSIDLPGGIHGGGYPYWKTKLYQTFAQTNQRLHLLRGDSHDPAMLAKLKTLIPAGGLDFLFIDGDHTYEGVKRDFELYAPLVRAGGLIALHDICPHTIAPDCEVDRFWNEVKQGRDCQELIENPQQGWAGIGLLRVSASSHVLRQ